MPDESNQSDNRNMNALNTTTPPEVEEPKGIGSVDLFGFKPSELLSNYPTWEDCAHAREPTLRPETCEWLYEWRMWDLVCSPMDDNERRRTRYGHYLGWHAAKKPNTLTQPGSSGD